MPVVEARELSLSDLRPAPKAARVGNREDLRSIPVFTIDPDNARDFDDAVHVTNSEGGWSVGIHTADVFPLH